ncbi:phage terminase small subunit [Sphingobium yanoikuyae]|uniref:phage terminase small subunit n=1 Tax=Sphingobium yanoikuyae TaxID=13690 RepID=UPI000847050F|nr:phage terminase small subunit [Sphingobium yanoikuyae]
MARLTPAQRHFARKSAEIAVMKPRNGGKTDSPVPVAGEGASAYQLQLAELDTDLKALKAIQALDRKIDLKRELIEKYDPWVSGVIDGVAAGGKPVQDDIVLHMMMWALDIGDHERALSTVSYVLDHDLALPERFSRTAPTFIAEVSADNALTRLQQGEDCDLDWLGFVADATAGKDMLDPVRAKLCKAIGLALGRRAEAMEPGDSGPAGGKGAALSAALAQLKEALRLHSAIGVKKEIDRLERLAKAIPAPTE